MERHASLTRAIPWVTLTSEVLTDNVKVAVSVLERGMPGENCEPLGNVLIIQESDKDVADDNAGGGILCFQFASPMTCFSIGLLDVAEDFLEVLLDNLTAPARIDVGGLGSNAFQTVEVGLPDASRACLSLRREGAITDVSFYVGPGSPEGSPGASPVLLSGAPSGSATSTSSSSPSLDEAQPSEPTRVPSSAPTAPSVSQAPSAASVSLTPSQSPTDVPSAVVTSQRHFDYSTSNCSIQ